MSDIHQSLHISHKILFQFLESLFNPSELRAQSSRFTDPCFLQGALRMRQSLHQF